MKWDLKLYFLLVFVLSVVLLSSIVLAYGDNLLMIETPKPDIKHVDCDVCGGYDEEVNRWDIYWNDTFQFDLEEEKLTICFTCSAKLIKWVAEKYKEETNGQSN